MNAVMPKKPSLMILLFLLLLATASRACVCPSLPPVLDAYEASAAVFQGVIQHIDVNEWSLDVSVQVTQIWKEVEPGIVHVSTESSLASCGFRFKEGTECLIFMDDNSHTDSCTYTTETGTWLYTHALEYIGAPTVDDGTTSWGRIKALYH